MDLHKANDFISGQAIEESLMRFGFSNSFASLVLDYMTTPKCSILIEGHLTSEFASGRDLCQGDLLSPTLFCLVLEDLSQQFHRARVEGKVDSFIQGGVKSPTHLMFADDLLYFTRENDFL